MRRRRLRAGRGSGPSPPRARRGRPWPARWRATGCVSGYESTPTAFARSLLDSLLHAACNSRLYRPFFQAAHGFGIPSELPREFWSEPALECGHLLCDADVKGKDSRKRPYELASIVVAVFRQANKDHRLEIVVLAWSCIQMECNHDAALSGGADVVVVWWKRCREAIVTVCGVRAGSNPCRRSCEIRFTEPSDLRTAVI